MRQGKASLPGSCVNSLVILPSQLVMVTLSGFKTQKARRHASSISSRTQSSRTTASMLESALLIPTRSQNSRRAAGGTPLLLNPDIVGNLGSFHPVTCFCSTNWINFRLESTVLLTLRRLNSICCGACVISPVGRSFSMVQS